LVEEMREEMEVDRFGGEKHVESIRDREGKWAER